MQLTEHQTKTIEKAMRDHESDESDWPTGEMVETIVEAALESTTLWVLTIDHKHGDNTSIHLSEEDAKDELYEYVTRWWSEITGSIQRDIPEVPPEDKAEAVRLYFEGHDYEYFSISEATITV